MSSNSNRSSYHATTPSGNAQYVNSSGNVHTSYSNGGYRYSNSNGSSYYATPSGAAFCNAGSRHSYLLQNHTILAAC